MRLIPTGTQRESGGEACGRCKSCVLFAARSQMDPLELRPDGELAQPWGHSAHPDLYFVGYEINSKSGKPRTEILIEQVRGLSERMGRWACWLIFGGMNLAFFPMHVTGLLGMPLGTLKSTVARAKSKCRAMGEGDGNG